MSLNKKALGTGAAVVALSAFVPNPFLMGTAFAQATATDTMNITASVVNPLSVNQVTKLNFGGFAVSATSGTYTANATKKSITNGVIITAATLGKVSFSAPNAATFTISIPDFNGNPAITLKNGAGASPKSTMKVVRLTLDATTKLFLNTAKGAADTFKSGKTTEQAKVSDAGGVGIATIGGVLNFKPTQVTGAYTGTYTMLITF